MIELTKWENVWRGVDYYKKRKVISWSESTNDKGEKIYTGTVIGTKRTGSIEDDNYNGEPGPQLPEAECKRFNPSDAPIYHVMINPTKPRNSTCDCPNAKGRQIICKHKIALLVATDPQIPFQVMQEIEEEEKAEKERVDRNKRSRRTELEEYAHDLSRAELEKAYVDTRISLDECIENLKDASRGMWVR